MTTPARLTVGRTVDRLYGKWISVMTNHDAPESVEDIQSLLAHLLANVAGKTEGHWKELIGPVTALPIVFHPRSNWTVAPKAKSAELAAIEKAVEIVRRAHPYVPSPKSTA